MKLMIELDKCDIEKAIAYYLENQYPDHFATHWEWLKKAKTGDIVYRCDLFNKQDALETGDI